MAPGGGQRPLIVGSPNFRFFIDSSGKGCTFSGGHLKDNLIDRSDKRAFDFASYLDFIKEHNHNFVRLWAWKQATWTHKNTAKVEFDPLPYQIKEPDPGLYLSRLASGAFISQ